MFPVGERRSLLPGDYAVALEEIKERIRSGRLRTVLAANAAMVLLYWDIGTIILARQAKEGWGAKVIDRLSDDLRAAYPEMHGLSARNLKYMRAFAAAWPDRSIVQGPLAQITWYHNIALLEQLDNQRTRLWYAAQAYQQGWSQSVMCHHIKACLHERQGKAVSNFKTTLPPADSDLAEQVFKDPYLFDFIGTADPRREREVYLSAVDDLLRHPDDKPTVGLLLCRTKNQVVVEYALRHLKRPVGVAEWETEIVKRLPEELRGSLPTVEELEEELAGARRKR